MAIYLDYMATTPIDDRVIDKMLPYMGKTGIYGNPSSRTHQFGQLAFKAVEQSRQQIADILNASPADIIFTSGATEANNLAILGCCRFYGRQGRHIITLKTEHKTVLASFQQLAKEGFEVDYLPVEPDGLLDINVLIQAIRRDTIFVSIMHVNNEIGVIQNIEAIGALLKEKGIIFHVDAAQSTGKLPLNLHQLPIDILSFSGHKIYGPKGIGALYLRSQPRVRLQPLSFGGEQEGGLRSGTLPTHQIVGLAEALVLAESLRSTEQQRILTLRTTLWQAIAPLGITLNGHAEKRIFGNLNLTVPWLEGEDLLIGLKDLAISTSSACLSSLTQVSYVLQALGLTNERIKRSIRLSIGRYTTEKEIEAAIVAFQKIKP